MIQAYLLLNAALYLLFAGWCTVRPESTAASLGLGFASGSGKSEYITVYGGMEFAFAAFFLVAALTPSMRSAGMIFAIIFYVSLVLWRLPTLIFIPGIHTTTYIFAAGELVLGLLALAVWWWNGTSAV